jgi:hypothetical protein
MKQRPKLLLLLSLPTLTLVAGLLMNPSSVHAASSQVLQSTPHFYWAQGRAPKSGGPTTSNLIYHGGPVMGGEMSSSVVPSSGLAVRPLVASARITSVLLRVVPLYFMLPCRMLAIS